MADNFESEKNLKAAGYTVGICAVMIAIFLFVSWTLPAPPLPPVEEGIEVNLGNSDQGSGKDQPFLPGKPAAEEKEKYTPPKPAPVVKEEAQKDVETDDNNKEEAPVVKKATNPKTDATKIPDKEIVKKTKVKPVRQPDPIPAPPKPPVPKARMGHMSGQTGPGGNDADDYKPGKGEGIAGGHGDQGAPGGNPDSKNYTGGGNGSGGVAISRGLAGRSITHYPSFTDDFNQNAKIAVDVHVDGNGNVVDADYQPRGSTTSDASMKAIALRKAKQIKMNATGDESVGTLIFNFKVHD